MATPVPWTRYRHSDIVSKLDYPCRKDIDYTIEISPSWILDEFYSCNEVEFTTRDETAHVHLYSEYLPNYSDNPGIAFRQVSEDYSEDYAVEDFLGNVTQVKVLTSEQIRHKGQDALLLTMEAKPELTFIYCTEKITRLIVLSQAWSSDDRTKRAYLVSTGSCKTNTRYDSSLQRIWQSFTPFIP